MLRHGNTQCSVILCAVCLNHFCTCCLQEVVANLQPSSMSILDFLSSTQQLTIPIDSFFDNVFVMCEDDAVRKNRLALLRDIANITKGVLDLSQLPGF